MKLPIDVKAASPSAVQEALGATLKEQIKQAGKITDFVERSGVSRSALYRLFKGDPVGVDVLITVLQCLGRIDALHVLLAPPSVNPMALIAMAKGASRLSIVQQLYKPKRPSSLQIEGLAKPKGSKPK